MNTSGIEPAHALAGAVASYRESGNIAELLAELDRIADGTDPHALAAAAEPYRDMVEVAGPIYEHIVEERPDDARALIILANCYWLAGRGPETVSELASRAMAADPEARGGWHLWALTEPDLRSRVGRWKQVVSRFPSDDLARVNLADNAASLASTEHDEEALALAIATYRDLRERATHPDQRSALDHAVGVLEAWRL